MLKCGKNGFSSCLLTHFLITIQLKKNTRRQSITSGHLNSADAKGSQNMQNPPPPQQIALFTSLLCAAFDK